MRLPARLRHFDFGRPFAPWFFRMVANDAIEATRRARRLVPLETVEFEALDQPAAARITPETLAQQAETSQELWALLGRLSPEQRAVVVLRFYAGLSNREIARELSIPAGTVGWRLQRGLKQVRQWLSRVGKTERGPKEIDPKETPS